MGIVCFASLKGGVGKTSLALNVAAAFAERGCKALIIDLDPTAHSSRLFLKSKLENSGKTTEHIQSPLARLLLEKRSAQLAGYIRAIEESNAEKASEDVDLSQLSLVDVAVSEEISLLREVRENLWLLPSGPELRHFYWGRAARLFRAFFPILLRELNEIYDYIILDTPPDFNILTRNAIAVADLVQVPLDSSVMSIHCLEQLVDQAAHIEGPCWSIVRTMVNKQASRIRRMSDKHLEQTLNLSHGVDSPLETEFDFPADNADELLELLEQEASKKSEESESQSPIFLLDSVVYRTEQQNQLSFLGSTAFERKANKALAGGYLSIAREIETILCSLEESELDDDLGRVGFGQSSAMC